MLTVDINSDLAEGFGAYTMGDDASLLEIVSSANVACGMHAGDPEIMMRTFQMARRLEVAVGAHPGFPDLWGFGRRRIPFSAGEIERLVAYQIGAAQAVSAMAGHPIGYVKAHGALGNLAAAERDVALAVARAVRAVDPGLALMAIALTELVGAGEDQGLEVWAEIFADRAFADGQGLVPRGQPGAMIEDEALAARRVLDMLEAGAVITLGGLRKPSRIDSICVHGDSPHAVGMARNLRARLEAAGVRIAAPRGGRVDA